MKVISTKTVTIKYVVPENDDERKEIETIIEEVKEEALNKDLSRYKLDKPEDRNLP